MGLINFAGSDVRLGKREGGWGGGRLGLGHQTTPQNFLIASVKHLSEIFVSVGLESSEYG